MVERVRIPGKLQRYRVGGSVKHPDKQHFGNASGKRGGARPNGKNGTGLKGKNPNSHKGRKTGTPNRMSKEIREKAAESGELPHEFMLRVMRLGPGGKIKEGTPDEYILTWDDIKWAASGCINYYAPKLSSINVGGSKEVIRILHIESHQLQGLTLDELAILEKVFGRLESTQVIEGEVIDADPKDYEATLH